MLLRNYFDKLKKRFTQKRDDLSKKEYLLKREVFSKKESLLKREICKDFLINIKIYKYKCHYFYY